MRRIVCRVGLPLLAVGGLVLVAPSLASANPLCGATLFQNTTLTRDQECPGHTGFYIGAPGITVNLNGFHLENHAGGDQSGTTGIDNTGGGTNPNNVCPCNRVTIEGGTIDGFGEGIVATGTNKNHFSNLIVVNNSINGIDFTDSSSAVFTSVVANGNGLYGDPADPFDGSGYSMGGNHKVTVSGGTASGNANDGVADDDSLATISGVTAANNGLSVCGTTTFCGDGFYVENPIRFVGSGGKVEYYLYMSDSAVGNWEDGFHITGNASASNFQAQVKSSKAEDNGEGDLRGFGWGYWATQEVAGGSTGNVGSGNFSGNCHNVPCTTG